MVHPGPGWRRRRSSSRRPLGPRRSDRWRSWNRARRGVVRKRLGDAEKLFGHPREFRARASVVVPEGLTQFTRGRWGWQRSRDGPDHAFEVDGWPPVRLPRPWRPRSRCPASRWRRRRHLSSRWRVGPADGPADQQHGHALVLDVPQRRVGGRRHVDVAEPPAGVPAGGRLHRDGRRHRRRSDGHRPAHAQTTFNVYNTPTASFYYTVLAGGSVQFTDTSTGEPTSWQWAFPGGTFSGRTPPAQVIPPRTPPWAVTLTVANPAGSAVVSVPVIVNGPPVAALTITPNPVGVNTPVTLNAGTSTDPNGDVLPLLLGSQRRPDVRRRDRRGPDTDLHIARDVPGRGEGDRPRVAAPMTPSTSSTCCRTSRRSSTSPRARPRRPSERPVIFTATASDPDGTVAALAWDLDGDGQFNDGTGAVVARTFSTPGSRIVSVHATDNVGVATIAFRTIEVTGSAEGQPAGPRRGGRVGAPTSSASRAKLAMLSAVPDRAHPGRDPPRVPRASACCRSRRPRGARVKVICHGGGCPKKKSLVLRVAFRQGTPCACGASNGSCAAVRSSRCSSPRPGAVGKYTRFTIRSNAAPPSRSLPAAGQVQARLVPGLDVLAAQLGEQQLRVHRADQLAQRLGARGDDLGGAVGLDLAGEAVEQRADLLLRRAARAPRGSAACRRR